MSEEIVKAFVVDGGPPEQASNVAATAEDDQRAFTALGAIVPLYDPRDLCAMYERSAALRPNIDAYRVNIEGFGYRMEPTINLRASDAKDRIRDSIILEKLYDGHRDPEVSDEEIELRRQQLDREMRIERLQTDLFFEYACAEMSFVELRERTRTDLEATGNGFWECIRNAAGEIAQFVYVPAVSIRLMRADNDYTPVEVSERVSAVSFRKKTRLRRFRRYVQVIYGQLVAYFKDLGDPRWISSRTGRIFATEAELRREEPNSPPATEMLHFKIHAPTTAYGVPRWVGSTLEVLGSRSASEVNLTYFKNKAVPPLAVLVSGGRLAAGAAERITNYIKDNIQGQENFHSVMVLEAEPSAGSAPIGAGGAQGSRVRIEIKPLMEAQQQDALFQVYDKNNDTKIGNAFRLPNILRGSTEAINRATAEAALLYAEQQVFQPERQKIDHQINAILAMRGVRFHRFVSNSAVPKDPAAIVEMISKLVEACIITPEEARPLVNDAFNIELARIAAPWVRIPPKLLVANVQPPPTPEEIEEARARGADKPVPNVQIAPTDAVSVMTVNEVRSALGLGPMLLPDGKPNPDGDLSIAEFQGKGKGAAVTGKPIDGPEGAEAKKPPPSLEEQAKGLLYLREALRELEGRFNKAALDEARAREGGQVFKVPRAEWNSWFDPFPAEEQQ